MGRATVLNRTTKHNRTCGHFVRLHRMASPHNTFDRGNSRLNAERCVAPHTAIDAQRLPPFRSNLSCSVLARSSKSGSAFNYGVLCSALVIERRADDIADANKSAPFDSRGKLLLCLMRSKSRPKCCPSLIGPKKSPLAVVNSPYFIRESDMAFPIGDQMGKSQCRF